MNHDDAKRERRLERLLAATHAPADPLILQRARRRILAAQASETPAWLAWFAHPAAVAGAAALCLACGVASVEVWTAAQSSGMVVRTENPVTVSALLGDDGSDGMPASSTTASAHGTADSGSVR